MNKLLFFAFWVLTLVVSYWVGLKSDSNRQNSQGEELAEITLSENSTKPIRIRRVCFPNKTGSTAVL